MRSKLTRVRRAASMAEVMVASLLVGVVVIGAMKGLGAVVRGRMQTGDSSQGKQLADQMMAEILSQAYIEPVDTPAFGVESPETSLARSDWDDVDDYHLWSSNPPTDQSGSALPGLTGWQRDVLVEWVDPGNPAIAVGSDQGIKKVTVTVQRNGTVIGRAVALRSDRGNP